MRIINTILDFLYPASCINCKAGGDYLCAECRLEIRPAERENLAWIYSRYDYRDPLIKKLIWLMKYKGKKALAGACAKILHEMLLEEVSDLKRIENWENAIVIPIPLSKKRKKMRGFNQSTLIGKALVRLDGGKFLSFDDSLLYKNKETIQQARIKNKKERLGNLKDSFKVLNPEKIKSKNIILVDDVTTTGATLSEAKKTLQKAGARKIIALTLAH